MIRPKCGCKTQQEIDKQMRETKEKDRQIIKLERHNIKKHTRKNITSKFYKVD